jgi:hypothetical protein
VNWLQTSVFERHQLPAFPLRCRCRWASRGRHSAPTPTTRFVVEALHCASSRLFARRLSSSGCTAACVLKVDSVAQLVPLHDGDAVPVPMPVKLRAVLAERGYKPLAIKSCACRARLQATSNQDVGLALIAILGSGWLRFDPATVGTSRFDGPLSPLIAVERGHPVQGVVDTSILNGTAGVLQPHCRKRHWWKSHVTCSFTLHPRMRCATTPGTSLYLWPYNFVVVMSYTPVCKPSMNGMRSCQSTSATGLKVARLKT